MTGSQVLAMVAAAFLAVLPETSAQLGAATSPFEQKVKVEAVRSRTTRIAGGDFDDKLDHISFTIKFTNTDPKTAFTDLTGEFYVLAQAIVDRKAYKLLGTEKIAISLPPLGKQESATGEVTTSFDTTGARFGAKYDGWVLVVRDSAGKVVMTKATSPSWQRVAEKLNTLAVGSFFDQSLVSKTNVR